MGLLLLGITSAHAQETERTISGMVQDKQGEPLIGANVYVKGMATLGTVTDFNGEFELSVPQRAKTLVFSYVGYATKEVAIKKDKAEYNVTMISQAALEEVVVTALGIERDERPWATQCNNWDRIRSPA